MMKKKKHLSTLANVVLQRCAQKLNTSVEALVEEFEGEWKPETSEYSRKLVEFCCTKALNDMCCTINETIDDGSFSRFTFDMMLAWETPSSDDDDSYTESVAKEKEDRKIPTKETQEQDEIPLFYSDIMPLLVDHEPSVGEDAFVWLGTLVPLTADVVNGRFTFESLTAATANRLHFPAYDKFLKEIDKCIKHLQKQATPKGVEFADDEFILHVEGTASTQRVVRHIGGTNWPGRLTLTNYALYFEASRALSYEDALKLDLSKNTEQSVKPAATGPFGAPLFDKAVVYESSELQESVVFEFPEMTSSTRRDHWLALIKEVIFLHRFLSKFEVNSPIQAWEMHARTILGIVRLHATREMLRISPPVPKNFLIFALFDELPKGDYVLEELAESLKKVNSGHPCSASSILRALNSLQPCASNIEVKEVDEESRTVGGQDDNLSSLESAVNQSRDEAKEIDVARATAEGLREEGIGECAAVLMELLRPLKDVLPWFREVFTWERPAATLIAVATTVLVVYKEWFGKALAIFLLWVVVKMLQIRQRRIHDKLNKVVVFTGSNKTTVESIVSAQHGLRTVQDMMQLVNVTILKIYSIVVSKAPKHANTVMVALTGSAIVLAVVPFKFILLALVLYCFTMTSNLGKYFENEQGIRRLREWWDSIPVVPVETVDKVPNSPT